MALAAIAPQITELSRRLGLSADLNLIDHAWQSEVGPLKEFARIAALDRSSLVVETDSPAVMQEISLRRRELLRKINRHLVGSPLREISVRLAEYYGR